MQVGGPQQPPTIQVRPAAHSRVVSGPVTTTTQAVAVPVPTVASHTVAAMPNPIATREVDVLRQEVSELRIKASEVDMYKSDYRDSRDEVRTLRSRVQELEGALSEAARDVQVRQAELETLSQDLQRTRAEKPREVIKEVRKDVITEVEVLKEVVTERPVVKEIVREVPVVAPTKDKGGHKEVQKVVVPDPDLQARIAELEAELAHRYDDEQLRHRDEQIRILEKKTAHFEREHQEAKHAHKREVDELQEGLRELQDQNQELTQQFTNSDRQLAVKNRQIADLQAMLDVRDNRASALEARIAIIESGAPSQTANELTREFVDVKNKLLAAESELKARDNYIESLQQQLKEHIEKDGTLFSPELAERQTQLERELIARTDECKDLRSQFLESERRFSHANEEIRLLNVTINQLRADLHSLSNHSLVMNRDEHIAVLERKLALVTEEFAHRENALRQQLNSEALAQKDEQIRLLQRKYTLAQQELEVFIRSKAAENEGVRHKLDIALDEIKVRDQRITELEEQVRGLVIQGKELEYQSNKVATMTTVVEKKEDYIRTLLERIDDLADARNRSAGTTKVVVQTVEVSHDEAKIAQLLGEVKKLEREVALRESTVRALQARAECTNSHLVTRIEERRIPADTSLLDSRIRIMEEEFNNGLVRKDSEIEQYKGRIRYLVQELTTKASQVNELTERLSSLDREYSGKFADTESLRARIIGYEAEIKKLKGGVMMAPRPVVAPAPAPAPVQTVPVIPVQPAIQARSVQHMPIGMPVSGQTFVSPSQVIRPGTVVSSTSVAR